MVVRLLVTCVVLSVCNLGVAASFDCAKAKSKMEKLICSDAQLSHLDEELNASYARVRDGFSDKKFLTTWQHDWLTSYGVSDCPDATCLRKAFVSRKQLLDEIATDGEATSANGHYERYYRGKLDRNSADINLIALKGNRYYVTGSALWYGAIKDQVHTGEMDGFAILNGKHITFRDSDRSDDTACAVEMEIKPKALEVVSSTMACGGMNVSFEGNYIKR